MGDNMYKIKIELSSRRLFLSGDKNIIGIYPVAIGKPSTPTPTGNFKVLNKINNPGGVLGTRWLQFTPQQHGIHGTNKPWLIGQAVSNGCVRMYNQDVEKVYDKVTIGSPVIIQHLLQAEKNTQKPVIYTVKKGDSLWSISLKFNSSIEKLKKDNNLKGIIIYPGQKLIIN